MNNQTPNNGYGYQQYSNPYQNPQQGYYYQGGRRPPNRSIALGIVLSLVTCGIYGLYWVYTLNEDMGLATGRKEMSSGMVVLLSLITCHIYSLIWAYQQGEKVSQIKQRNGQPGSGDGILYLLLSFFGFDIVVWALMQSELNNVADGRYFV